MHKIILCNMIAYILVHVYSRNYPYKVVGIFPSSVEVTRWDLNIYYGHVRWTTKQVPEVRKHMLINATTIDCKSFAVKNLNTRNILCNVCWPIPILVTKVRRWNLDYVKYFTCENIPIYGTVIWSILSWVFSREYDTTVPHALGPSLILCNEIIHTTHVLVCVTSVS